MPVTDQQIDGLVKAVREQAAAFARKHGLTFDLRTFSGTTAFIVQTAFGGGWDDAALLDLGSGQFVKGAFNARTMKLRIAKKQPKSMPSIDSYALLRNGDIPGTNGGRVVVLGASHQAGGEVRPFAN